MAAHAHACSPHLRSTTCLYDQAVLTGIGPHVSVHLYSAQATVDGGHISEIVLGLDLPLTLEGTDR